jgi:Tol biopolymer transport system component
MQLPRDERAAFVERECGDDRALRAEVEALLVVHEASVTRVAGPAAASPAPPGDASALASGVVLEDKYRVEKLIGRGGMGEVYRARDLRIGRDVAVKVLPPAFAADTDRLRRFELEVHAAGRLNHPNVLVIYDVGVHEGAPFVVSELLEGEPLRARLARGPMPAREAVELAAGVARGLAAAHAKGIVHRDLKPENVFVTEDGRAKVLDFGLAKLVRAESDRREAEPTLLGQPTESGLVIGTPAYMSPEQLVAEPLDLRTDIFSFGSMLYEMVSGRPAFRRRTGPETMSAILNEEPEPLGDDGLAGVERVVRRCVAKSPADRYQTDAELEAALGEALEASGQETAAPLDVGTRAVAATTGEEAARTTGSMEAAPFEARRRGATAIAAIAAVAAVVLLVAGGYGVVRLMNRATAPAEQAHRTPSVKRLTTNGRVKDVALSPDGRFAAYTTAEAGKETIWLKQTSPGTDVQLMPPLASSEGGYSGLDFSADGNAIYFATPDPSGARSSLFRVPILGGPPKKLLSYDSDGRAAVSADGAQYAFVQNLADEGAQALVVANVDGTGSRRVAVRREPEWFYANALSWSPDGKTIACGVGSGAAASYVTTVVGISVEDGGVRPLTPKNWAGQVVSVKWIADGSGVLVLAQESFTKPFQVWLLPLPAGDAVQVTSDVDGYDSSFLSVTADGQSAAALLLDSEFRIDVVAPGEDPARVAEITRGRNDGAGGLCWGPGDRLVFTSTLGEGAQLWSVNADGTALGQLTEGAADGSPSVSSDGRVLVFASLRSGYIQVWKSDAEGGNARQLTQGIVEDSMPSVSPDGTWVAFRSWRSGAVSVWKVSIEGGEPVQLTTGRSLQPCVSPDGKGVLCVYYDERSEPKRWVWAVVPAEGGDPVRTVPVPPSAVNVDARWASDGRSILYVERAGEVDNVWSLALDGGKPRQVTRFTSGHIRSLAVSPDGRRLALSRGTESVDAVLIRDFR